MTYCKTLLIIFALSVTVNIAIAQAPRDKSTPVIVIEINSKDYNDRVQALGTLRARESVELTSTVTEVVTTVSFVDNQRVSKGDVLLEMDASEDKAALEEQKSFALQAQRQVDRLEPLVERRAASLSLLDESRRELNAAKARMNAIQSRIDKRTIRAPFDGVLGLRNISVGALVTPGVGITTIDDDTVMRLDFSVPEVFLASLKPGLTVKARTEAYPDQVFEGEIASLDSRIDPITRSIQARAILQNSDGRLKPGLLMKIDLQKKSRQALVVPEETLTANGPDNYVFVVSEVNHDYVVERRKVTLGTRQFGEAEVVAGLVAGERVVTHGILRIKSGDKVSITAVETGREPLEELLKASNRKPDGSDNEGI